MHSQAGGPPFVLAFSRPHQAAGCPTLYGEARLCFLRFRVKGGIKITRPCPKVAPISGAPYFVADSSSSAATQKPKRPLTRPFSILKLFSVLSLFPAGLFLAGAFFLCSFFRRSFLSARAAAFFAGALLLRCRFLLGSRFFLAAGFFFAAFFAAGFFFPPPSSTGKTPERSS
jgi:hypothetical protein